MAQIELNERTEQVRKAYYTKEIDRKWWIFDEFTAIFVCKKDSWVEVSQWATEQGLPCREYDRERNETILYDLI